MSDTKPFLLEITGETEFHMGNSAAPILVDIALGYQKKEEGERYLYAILKSGKREGITVEDVIKSCTARNVNNIPDILKNVAFQKFSVVYGSGGLNATELTIQFDCRITINDKPFDASIIVEYEKNNENEVTFSFKGKLKVDTHQFNLQFTKKEDAWYLFAAYDNREEVTIYLREIAAKFFGEDQANKMPQLSFTLSDFKAFILYKKEEEDTSMLFGMGAGLELNLNDLPMAGPILSHENSFAFKEVLAIYAKGTFEKEELKMFDGMPAVEVNEGFNISTELQINGNNEYYVLNDDGGGDYPEQTLVPQETNNETNVAPLSGTGSSKAKWKNIDKKIGPVTIQRLGFMYQDGKVVLLLDASMEMAGMGIQLMGFGLGFKLEWPPGIPDFYLDGLGLSYKAPPIEISGAFLHSKETYNGETIDVYNGGAIIKIKQYTISAIGSYTKVEDQASLFIYGVLDSPIGGPAFFFVTGIAAGFGYNRKVNLPSINEVALFPLVALAMKPENDAGLPAILTSLETPMRNGKKPIEISIGDYWLAVGIKFTSFNIIESFVLLTVNFGTQLEFAILGLSKLSWPEKSIASEPIVYIELAILAHFGPDSDVISVEAVITPNSYLLSKDCKLSGGFAFYTWVKGPHEGDFVVTLGGYHPKFIKPAHYPTVPRLSLSWKISRQLSIKGEMYYALTSSSIMVGGKWEVMYKTSVVKVTIVLWADMLIYWAPFQYRIDIGISLRIEAKIKIAFVRVYFNFEMSAQLHIWGPPFAGKVYVDWSVFSFTIPFGNHAKKAPAKLNWNEFSTGFIPQKKVGTGPDPINITIGNGLIEVKGADKFPIINPQQLAVSIDSFIPVTAMKVNDELLLENTVMNSAIGNTTYDQREQKIGVRPCGFETNDVKFDMGITVTLKGSKVDMSFICTAKGVAEALWGAEESNSSNSNPGTSKVMSNVLTGLIIQPPTIPQVSQIRTFDFSKLFDRSGRSFDWKFTQAQAGEAYHAYDVLGYYNDSRGEKEEGILEKTYMAVIEKRRRIHTLLKTGFDETLPEIEETEVDDRIMKIGIEYFKGIPVICEIGQIPQYSTDVK